jgi:hypothetical protein
MASYAAAHGLRLRLRTADGPVRPRVAALVRSCRNWQTGTLEVRVLAGSNPAGHRRAYLLPVTAAGCPLPMCAARDFALVKRIIRIDTGRRLIPGWVAGIPAGP